MNSVYIPNPTRVLNAPKDWDDNLHGKCDVLPIIDYESVMYSYWKPTWKERIAIFFGKNSSRSKSSSNRIGYK